MAAPREGSLGVLTTKGDLLVVLASGDVERLAVGADDQILVADSTEPSGFRWAIATDVAGNAALAFGADNVAATATTRFLFPYFAASLAPTSAIQIPAPRAGTLRNMRVRHNTVGTMAVDITYTVRVGGVASSLAVTLAANAVTGSDLANAAVVAAGDLLDIEITKAGVIGQSPMDIYATLEYAA